MPTKPFSPCIVIPVYNHHHVIEQTVKRLLSDGYPVVLVDDGSNETTKAVLSKLSNLENTYLQTLSVNQGKGAAVVHGLTIAQQLGFTHALQVDADGQHNLEDVERFLNLASSEPGSVICGYPQYDESVPKLRFYGRYLTHVWVWIECLSFEIKDSMCGFRVYPLNETLEVINRISVGKRMDFDTEVLVKLYWNDVPIINVPTDVIYPEQGVSHFNAFRDNWLISKMHTRLFFGMLARFPKLLKKNIRRWIKSSESAHNQEQSTRSQERATKVGMAILLRCFKWFGLTPVYLLLYPITLYYFLTSPAQRRASIDYLRRLKDYSKSELEHVEPNWKCSYRHFYTFSRVNADKMALWAGRISPDDFVLHNRYLVDEIIEDKKGGIFLVSHIGNIDAGRALAFRIENLTVNNIVAFDEAPIFNSTLNKISDESNSQLIMVSDLGIDTGVLLKQKVDNGEIVVIAGDRVNHKEQVVEAPFLGRNANFPSGPFVLASMLGCPVYSFVSLRVDGQYHLFLDKLHEGVKLRRGERQQQLEHLVTLYASQLAKYCEKAPLQWFNFFDFWGLPNTSDVRDER